MALGEEMLFRGLVQRSYQKVLSAWSAILMASIQFAVMHLGWLNPLEIAFSYVMGIFFGYSWKTKSLITPVIAHSMGNIIVFLIAAYPDVMFGRDTQLIARWGGSWLGRLVSDSRRVCSVASQ